MKEGWKEVRLGEVCESINGLWKGKKEPFVNVGVIRSANFTNDCKIDFSNIEYLDVETKAFAKRKLQKGDLIIERSGGSDKKPVGRAMLFDKEDGDYSFSNFTSVLRITDTALVVPQYLFSFLLHTYKSGKTKKMQSNTIGLHNLDFDMYREIVVPLPPLPEQQRIVSVLDSAFAKIEQMKRNAEMALLDAQDVFKNTLDDMMTMKEGWEEKRLGEVCKIDRGKRFVRNDIVSEGVPCIHYGDIYTYYGLYTYKSKGYISHELAKKMRFAYKNDVVVVQAGENPYDIGVGVAWLGDEPAAVHDACFILRHNQNPLYLSYYLRSSEYHYNLRGYVHEGKICSFLKPALENAIIPLPPLPEQQRIVSVLDDLSVKCKQLESNYRRIMEDCEEMKQAILTRAMNGEL